MYGKLGDLRPGWHRCSYCGNAYDNELPAAFPKPGEIPKKLIYACWHPECRALKNIDLMKQAILTTNSKTD